MVMTYDQGTPDTAVTTRQMVDSAFPMGRPPSGGWRDIILIYSGGDTVHPWTLAEIKAMPARYRWPCWVRSNPSQVNPLSDAGLFAAWLHGHGVPMGTCVILDLETAIDAAYVSAFNLAMRAAGYKVTKYGSQDFIWKNPKTDGGTYVALPGRNELTTEGDTVARQYAFDGGYDLSIVQGQGLLRLWDTRPPVPPVPARTRLVKGWWLRYDINRIAEKYHVSDAVLVEMNPALRPYVGTGRPVRLKHGQKIRVPA
jgi:hypothetical protein